MPIPHATTALPPLPGPPPLDLLDFLYAHTTGELAFLHSATGESHSILAFDPLHTIEINAACPAEKSPLAFLDQTISDQVFSAPHPLVGWLGFISYDIAHTLEQLPLTAPDELHWPLLRWTLFRHYLLHDPQSNQWTPISIDADPASLRDLLQCAAATAPPSSLPPPDPSAPAHVTPPLAFLENVERVKQYIAAGDIYQANIARHWQIPHHESPPLLYRRLCQASPAPYAGFLRFTAADAIQRHVLSASPELFLHKNGDRLITRPIKGTRRRNLENPVLDAQLADELLASPKDQAELAMIVDLMRNDLGRIARIGSVAVESPRDLQAHPTVWHTVATIAATLNNGATLADLLSALCPGGSITGAPKIRAMQIIEQLENFRRGLYCGNIGVIGPQAQTLTLNIAIRTLLLQSANAHLYAGAGIVADSLPQLELEETHHKAAALLRALNASQ